MDINWPWVTEQLKQSGTSQQLSTSILRLLETLETMRLEDDALRQVLDKFQRLSLGYSIVPDSAHERWEQCMPGNYTTGDTVRVKPDAYDGVKSTAHNGRRGRVVGSRGGSAIVVYDGTSSSEEQYYHPPEVLERLM